MKNHSSLTLIAIVICATSLNTMAQSKQQETFSPTQVNHNVFRKNNLQFDQLDATISKDVATLFTEGDQVKSNSENTSLQKRRQNHFKKSDINIQGSTSSWSQYHQRF